MLLWGSNNVFALNCAGDHHIFVTQEDITIFENPYSDRVTIEGDFRNYQIHLKDASNNIIEDYTGNTSPLTIDLQTLGNEDCYISIENDLNSQLKVRKNLKPN